LNRIKNTSHPRGVLVILKISSIFACNGGLMMTYLKSNMQKMHIANLTLFFAESDPRHKDKMVRLVLTLIKP